MNPNNYFNLEATKFIEIIEGNDQFFSQPQRSNPRISLEATNRAREASGLEPECTIHVPTLDERQEGWRQQMIYTKPYTTENRPDPKEPFVYRVTSPIYWYRGINYSSAEGVKPELSCGINLQYCEFTGQFSIMDVQSRDNITLINCAFKNIKSESSSYANLNVSSSKFKEFSIINSKDTNYQVETSFDAIKFENLQCEKLLLNGLQAKKLTLIGQKTVIKELIIINCEIGTLIINCNGIDQVYISETVINHELNVSGNISYFKLFTNQIFQNSKNRVARFSLSLDDSPIKGEFIISDMDIQKLTLSGTSNNKILIGNSIIKIIEMNNLTNLYQLRLYDIIGINILTISDSLLGNCQFTNVDIPSSCVVKIVSSNLMEIILINTVFHNSLRGNNIDDFYNIREAYRQLKYSSAKQGNRILELYYEALEMDAFQKDTKTYKSLDERAILYFNMITNNHGQSWLKALKLLFTITIPSFCLIKLTLGYRTFDASLIAHNIAQYFEFSINPLHDFNKLFQLKEENVSNDILGYARLLDNITKLGVGLILFQLVRAFRKYVK